MNRACAIAAAAVLLLTLGAPAHAARSSLARDEFAWPTAEQCWRVFTLADYNTRIVVFGTAVLGAACGLVGSFLLLRRRALMGDVLSHAMLPGIALAYIVVTQAGGMGKALPVLLVGGAASGLAGVGVVLFLRRWTRLKEDAAMGIVLSVFFGAGTALLGVVQQMRTGSAAGLETFVYGKAASLALDDVWLISAVAGGAVVLCLALFKELSLMCFDEGFSRANGLPVDALDLALMALVVAVTVVGLQAVGLVLVIALLVIPPAAARFWTDHLPRLALASTAIGATSGLVGSAVSALFPRMPAGAVIVLVCSLCFVVSLVLGPARGIVPRVVEHARLVRRVARQHLLRALFECEEAAGAGEAGIPAEALLAKRSWSARELAGIAARERRAGRVRAASGGGWRLTDAGREEAKRYVRNHRLWELYLIEHADVAASHVDRGADHVEHVLGAELVASLERILAERARALPESPHALVQGGAKA